MPSSELDSSSPDCKRRLLIVEEALRNRDGHWFEYNRATKAAVQSPPAIQVEMLGHRTMDQDVADELGARPHFRFTVWDQIYNSPRSWKRYFGIAQHNYRLFRDLDGYLSTAEHFDTVFAPTVVLHHLLGYHAIAKRHAGKKFDQLVLLIRNNIAFYDGQGQRTFRGTSRFWRWAIRRFLPLIRSGKVRFVTDSERLADEYEQLTGIRFEILPHPSLVGIDSTDERKPSMDHERVRDESIQIFLPGPARYEKGVDCLLKAARELATIEGLPRIQILFQWSQPFSLPDGTTLSPDDVTRYATDRITFKTIRVPLSSEAYLDLLSESDIIILPYRREAYFARISGVAVEAMMLGKPLLYTEDTWVGAMARQFGVGVAMGSEPDAVARAIGESINRLEQLRQIARSRQTDVAEFFSAENFRRQLVGTLQELIRI